MKLDKLMELLKLFSKASLGALQDLLKVVSQLQSVTEAPNTPEGFKKRVALMIDALVILARITPAGEDDVAIAQLNEWVDKGGLDTLVELIMAKKGLMFEVGPSGPVLSTCESLSDESLAARFAPQIEATFGAGKVDWRKLIEAAMKIAEILAGLFAQD